MSDLGAGATALAFGPEEGMLYLGLDDAIVRVPIIDDPEQGIVAGTAQDHLDLDGQCGAVAGLAFDAEFNLWIGCPDTQTLAIARPAGAEPPTVSRTFTSVDPALAGFIGVGFGGGGGTAGDALYWANDNGEIGRLVVGRRALP